MLFVTLLGEELLNYPVGLQGGIYWNVYTNVASWVEALIPEKGEDPQIPAVMRMMSQSTKGWCHTGTLWCSAGGGGDAEGSSLSQGFGADGTTVFYLQDV